MKKLKKRFLKNKILFVLIAILIVCFIFIIYGAFRYFYTGFNKNAYGERLNEIKSYKLDNNIENKVRALYNENAEVEKLSLRQQGKIIYITINFKSGTKVEDAKNLSLKSLEGLSKEEKELYDIQYILTSEDNKNETFPTMGYKNSLETVVSWINN